ncbi:MAG: FAD-dependent oxidoreductase, partial [Actinomycetota bacterium]
MKESLAKLPPLKAPGAGPLLSLTINGREVSAHGGDTVLDAAKTAGIKIPYLCRVKGLEPQGGCRVCIVEIEGEDRPQPSCATPVAEGMKVTTDSERLERLRKTYLELMLSDHNAYCTPPCKYGCPTNVDGAGFIGLIADGDLEESQRVLKANLPFPSILGRVCPHPCEDVCRREEVDEPVSICLSHRYVGDVAIKNRFHPEEPDPPTGKRAAVIGAGPAGLTNAYYLALKGHEVTIFEALPQPGGMLRYGIPEYRLPKDILDAELEPLWEMGVKLKTGMSLGPDFTIESLLGEQGFDAVFLGLGAVKSRPMKIEGEDLEGVMPVVDFLLDNALGVKVDVGKHVIVIGGGFSAMDAARVSVRLGAEKVTVVYRRTEKEMPAHEAEVRDAMEEGVEFVFLAAPTRIEGSGGRITAIEFQKMELGEPDESGRRRPEPVAGSEYMMEADTVIPAVGQLPRLTYLEEETKIECAFLPEESQVQCTSWQTVSVNDGTGQTDRAQVFAGGDVVTGAATVVEAVAAGKQAAWAMDAFLKGKDVAAYEASLPEHEKPPFLPIPAYREEQEA